MSIKVESFSDRVLSKFQCGFRKILSVQNYLLSIKEKWRKCFKKVAFAELL